MIEMHLGDGPIDDDDRLPYPNRIRDLGRLAFSAPSLAIASLAIGFASLTIVEASEELGDAVLFSAHGKNPSELTTLRVSAAVRLVLAIVALVLAVASGLRLRATDLDDEPADPLWLRAVAGAGLVVAMLAIVVAGASLIYVFRLHPGTGFGG